MPVRFQRHSYSAKPRAVVADRQQRQRRVEMRVGVVRLRAPAPGRSSRARRWWRLSAASASPRLSQALTMVRRGRERAGRRPRARPARGRARAAHCRGCRARADGRARARAPRRSRRAPARPRPARRSALPRLISAWTWRGSLRQHRVEGGDRLGRPLEIEQHVAAIVERVEMAGRERQRLVEARQRLVAALERVQHQREVRQRVGRARIAP